MTKADLLELLANGENSHVAFNRDDLRPEILAREVVAFANFQGGRVILGVEDDGTIVGAGRANLEEWITDTVFGQYVHPTIMPFYQEIRIDDQRRIAVLSIDQGITKPYVVRNNQREDIYVRMGSTSRLASREQQACLFPVGGMLHPEQLPVSGSTLADLSLDRLRNYLSSIVKDQSLPSDPDAWHRRLCGLGLMTERDLDQPVCTVAGMALFGHKPRRHLRHGGVRWMAFDGTEKSCRALDDRVCDGPLVALRRELASGSIEVSEDGLIEKVIDFMTPFISTESDRVDVSMVRSRSWEYPLEAVREAIVNALAHRDWTRHEEVEVVRYQDRLEILSPGALQNSMTVERIIAGQRSARNPLMVDVLRDYGYVDARGMGVRNKIIPLLRTCNGTEPRFDATEDYLRVVLLRAPRQPSH